MTATPEKLTDILDLERLEVDLFRERSPHEQHVDRIRDGRSFTTSRVVGDPARATHLPALRVVSSARERAPAPGPYARSGRSRSPLALVRPVSDRSHPTALGATTSG
jgi:hypothetical protein